jgi:hypothetical protein
MPTHLPGSSLEQAKARFNGRCRLVALGFLVVVLPLSLHYHPTTQDLSGIYVGPMVARQGNWEALYPIPSLDRRLYIGEKGQGRQKQELLDMAADHGIVDPNPYLNPPWQVIAVLPLGWLTYAQAQWAVVLVNIFCVWCVAVVAGRGFEICAGHRSWTAGFITLAVAVSPLAYRSIRVQNLSPAVALCIAMALWDLLGLTGRSGFVGGLGMAWGALFKLATLALVPLAVALRKWRLLGWMAGLIVLGVMVCWQMAGAPTFHEFFANIAPSLGRSSINPGNKSLQGFLLRFTGVAPLGHKTSLILQCVQALFLAAILWALLRPRGIARQAYWSQPPRIFAAAAALLAWLLIFSPLCWEHYFMYLVPLWGWLCWEATLSRPRCIAVILSLAAFWVPLPKLNWLTVAEPWNSYMLGGLFVVLILALMRLYTPQKNSM